MKTPAKLRHLIGKTYRSTYTVAGGVPQVQFVIARAKSGPAGIPLCRSEHGFEWYPLTFAKAV